MRRKTIAFCILVIAALSLMVWACGRSEPAPTPLAAGFTPTPYVPASAVEGASTAEEREPTPTPVPPQAREAALEFAVGHRAIGRDWDRFHADFDAWREELVACDPGSVQVALAGFASSFAAVAEEARGLPRAAVVRELANEAIAAAQQEEQTLRHLRDNWEPEAPAVFEGVAVERSAASELRQGIEDRLGDLQIRTSLSSRDQAAAFSGALQQLNADWDGFHQRYEALRAEQGQLTSAETLVRLSELVGEFTNVVLAVRGLPDSQLTRELAQTIARAAEAEDLALRELRDALGESGGAAGGRLEGDAAPQLGGDAVPQLGGGRGTSRGFTGSVPAL